ncbi:MAG TPA: DUF3267 domain-containing protein, partial [Marinagarivorans sp.]|nr:DUF3267 domain-containing protein [Marinagarivorans sp.]
MRFILGGPPIDPFLASTDAIGWKPLTKTGFVKYSIAVAIATLIVGGATLAALEYSGVFSYSVYAKSHADSVYFITLLSIVLIVVPHELVHLLLMPNFGLSNSSMVGFWPKKIIFYAFHVGQMSKLRILAVVAGPLIVLTVMPIALSAALGVTSNVIGLAALSNALVTGIDIMTLCKLLLEVPKSGCIRQSGDNIFYLD